MENLKEKIIIAIAIITAIVICAIAYYLMFYQKDIYYTQIDNSKVIELSTSDNMKFEYTLACFNKKGKEKELKFKTSRKLKEDAYLKLEVMITRGVISWEEIQENELPDNAKINYQR